MICNEQFILIQILLSLSLTEDKYKNFQSNDTEFGGIKWLEKWGFYKKIEFILQILSTLNDK